MVLSGFEWFRTIEWLRVDEWIPLKTTQNHLKQHVSSGCEWFCVVLSGFEWF